MHVDLKVKCVSILGVETRGATRSSIPLNTRNMFGETKGETHNPSKKPSYVQGDNQQPNAMATTHKTLATTFHHTNNHIATSWQSFLFLQKIYRSCYLNKHINDTLHL